jgi:hypothetical protein
MNAFQRLLCSILPASRAQAIEAESRAWRMHCPCGHSVSVWEAGGIRYKAAGNPRKLRRCPECGTRTWHRLEKEA